MNTITVDHCIWVRLIDKDKSEAKGKAAQASEQLMDYCLENGVTIYFSTRVWNWDAVTMSDKADHHRLEALISQYKAQQTSAGFRLGEFADPRTGKPSLIGPRGSSFGDMDMLTDHPSVCPKTLAFKSVFGEDPIDRHPDAMGSKLPNWIGDYDALKGHYLAGHGIFVTLDASVPCFDPAHRQKAYESLGLLIQSPEDALTFLRQSAL